MHDGDIYELLFIFCSYIYILRNFVFLKTIPIFRQPYRFCTNTGPVLIYTPTYYILQRLYFCLYEQFFFFLTFCIMEYDFRSQSVCMYFFRRYLFVLTVRCIFHFFIFRGFFFFRPCAHAITHLYIGVSTKRTPVMVSDPDFLFRAFLPV